MRVTAGGKTSLPGRLYEGSENEHRSIAPLADGDVAFGKNKE